MGVVPLIITSSNAVVCCGIIPVDGNVVLCIALVAVLLGRWKLGVFFRVCALLYGYESKSILLNAALRLLLPFYKATMECITNIITSSRGVSKRITDLSI